jgi:hypothetical protein
MSHPVIVNIMLFIFISCLSNRMMFYVMTFSMACRNTRDKIHMLCSQCLKVMPNRKTFNIDVDINNPLLQLSMRELACVIHQLLKW